MGPVFYVRCFHQKKIHYILSFLWFSADLSGGFLQVAGGNFQPREFWFRPNVLLLLHTHRLMISLVRFENPPFMRPPP